MKKIDWYILKKFYTTFLYIIVMMLLIVLVIDYSEKTDDFVKAQKSFSQVFQQYYVGFVPHIVALLFHLFVFIAVIFFTSKMANQTEVIPILAAGVSYNRYLRPYLVGSTILALLLWWASNGLIPRSNKLQTEFKSKYIDRNTSVGNICTNYCNKYLRIDSNTYAGIKQYDTTSKSAQQFFYNTVKNNKVVRNFRGSSFKWDTAKPHKNTWRIENIVHRVINKDNELDSFVANFNKTFNFTPDDIKFDDYVKDKLTTPQLQRFIALEKKRGSEGISKLQVELYRRGATAFAVIILTLIGVFIASRKRRGGTGMQLAMGVILAFVYILLDKFSTVFAGNDDIPAALAAWLPNIIFSIVAIILYAKAQK
jgi:lipopolysaccharide export system permease protein